MMRAPRFRYVAARSVADAAAALADGGPGAMLLAGGTDLVPNLKRRQHEPSTLISLRRIEDLRGIVHNGETVIGGGTAIADVARDRRHAALASAASQIASPAIRNAATLAGNLCIDTRCNYYDQSHEWRRAIGYCLKAPGECEEARCWVAPAGDRCWAVASSDAAPALIALGARVTLESLEGERDLALEDLYADDGIRHLTKRPDEILTAVLVPSSGFDSVYLKLRRRGSIDFPVLGVAAAVRFNDLRVVEEARVVLGAVASRPLLLPESPDLVGKALTDRVIEEFAERAATHAKPLDNTDFAMTWRKRMARKFVADALRALA